MKGLFLGAHSHLARLLLKHKPWSHVLLQSQTLHELQSLAMSLPQGVHVDLFPCDFENVHETAFIEYQERLSRFDSFDVVVLTLGSWKSYARFEHNSLEDFYTAWQLSYFYPLSLLKNALALMPKGTHVYYWTFNDATLKQPLWTAIQPILVAWDALLAQLAVEQGWHLHPIKTGFVRSPQSLKLFPSGEPCQPKLDLLREDVF